MVTRVLLHSPKDTFAAALALARGVDRVAVYRLYDNAFTPGVSRAI